MKTDGPAVPWRRVAAVVLAFAAFHLVARFLYFYLDDVTRGARETS
jgi:hypothetical protein